jgi:molybdenum cofactor cytidylyltransferase
MSAPQHNSQHIPALVVLAAGAGYRWRAAAGTGDKLAAPVAGRPLLAWTLQLVRRAHRAPASTRIVTLAPRSPLATLVAAEQCTPVEVDDASDGMWHSLRAGLAAAHAVCPTAGVVVLAGDDPLCALALPQLLAVVTEDPTRVAFIDRANGAPHPVYLPPVVAADPPHPAAGAHDRGLRSLLGDPSARALTPSSDLPNPVDLDTPSDLARLEPLLLRAGGT